MSEEHDNDVTKFVCKKNVCIYHTIRHYPQKLILSNKQILMRAASGKRVRCDSVSTRNPICWS